MPGMKYHSTRLVDLHTKLLQPPVWCIAEFEVSYTVLQDCSASLYEEPVYDVS